MRKRLESFWLQVHVLVTCGWFYPNKKWLRKKRSVVIEVVFWLLFSEEEGGSIFTQSCQVLVWNGNNKQNCNNISSYLSCSNAFQNKQTKEQLQNKIPTLAHKIDSQIQDLAKFYKPRNSRNKPDPQMYKAKKRTLLDCSTAQNSQQN